MRERFGPDGNPIVPVEEVIEPVEEVVEPRSKLPYLLVSAAAVGAVGFELLQRIL